LGIFLGVNLDLEKKNMGNNWEIIWKNILKIILEIIF
jgi:hypothetical protein